MHARITCRVHVHVHARVPAACLGVRAREPPRRRATRLQVRHTAIFAAKADELRGEAAAEKEAALQALREDLDGKRQVHAPLV